MPVSSWSTTAADNATADSASGIIWSEGQAPSSINDSARAMMAGIAADVPRTLTRTDVSSAVASADFTLPSGYRYFRLIFSEVQGTVSNAQLGVRVSENAGSSYFSASGDYLQQTHLNTTASALATVMANTATIPPVTGTLDTANTKNGGSGVIEIFPGSAAKRASMQVYSQALGNGNNYLVRFDSSVLVISNTNRIDRVRLLMNSGNIATGKFTLEGFV